MGVFKKAIESTVEKEEERKENYKKEEERKERRIEEGEKIRLDAQACIRRLAQKDEDFKSYINGLMLEGKGCFTLASIEDCDEFDGDPYRVFLFLKNDDNLSLQLIMRTTGEFGHSFICRLLGGMSEYARERMEKTLGMLQDEESVATFFVERKFYDLRGCY